MKKNLLPLILLFVAISGCGQSGPPSTSTSSSEFATLPEKIEFLEQYVTFRRHYVKLDYQLNIQTNNSRVSIPGPNDWFIGIIAVVPPEEIQQWTKGLTPVEKPDTEWMSRIKTTIDTSGVNQWYEDGHRTVGVDEANAVIVYLNYAM